MAGRYPFLQGQRIENAGAVTATSRGTVITASASANVKGTYTQLIAATAFQADGILVMFDDQPAVIDFLVDIAVGAAASEKVILSNLLASGGTGSLTYGMHYYFPQRIPVGTRLAARCQASTLSSIIRVSCLLFSQGVLPGEALSVITPYGQNTADSGAVSIDPGGSANTKGAYVQIEASTTYLARFMTIVFGNQLNAVRSSQSWLVDVAIGAAAAEKIIVPNLSLNCSTSPDIIVPQSFNMLPVQIPPATRIAVRAQSDGIDATDRLFDCGIYLVT